MKSLGCYYFLTFFPSEILLEDQSSFVFEFNGKNIYILIIKHLKSIIINDFNNELNSFENNGKVFVQLKDQNFEISEKSIYVKLENSTNYVLDYKNHLYREFSEKEHTQILVSFEGYKEDDNLKVAIKALNNFVNVYKTTSGDFYTQELDRQKNSTQVKYEYFHEYSNEELTLNEEDRVKEKRGIKPGIKQLQIPNYTLNILTSKSENAKKIEALFKSNQKPQLIEEFIFKARQELLINHNYKYSFIESWTAIEISIVEYLRKIKLQKGISKNKLDELESEIAISYLINIEMFLVNEKIEESFKTLISKINGLRKIRNDVVHKNREIIEKEAKDAFDTLIEFLRYTGYNIKYNPSAHSPNSP